MLEKREFEPDKNLLKRLKKQHNRPFNVDISDIVFTPLRMELRLPNESGDYFRVACKYWNDPKEEVMIELQDIKQPIRVTYVRQGNLFVMKPWDRQRWFLYGKTLKDEQRFADTYVNPSQEHKAFEMILTQYARRIS